MKSKEELEKIEIEGCPNMAMSNCIQDCINCDWTEEDGRGLPQGCWIETGGLNGK